MAGPQRLLSVPNSDYGAQGKEGKWHPGPEILPAPLSLSLSGMWDILQVFKKNFNITAKVKE